MVINLSKERSGHFHAGAKFPGPTPEVGPLTISHSSSQGLKQPLSFETVGTEDFLFCPRCPNTRKIVSPPGYYMFVLVRVNSFNSVIFIENNFLKTLAPVNHMGGEKVFYLKESKVIGSRLAMFYQEARGDYLGRDTLLGDLARLITSLLLKSLPRPAVLTVENRKIRSIDPAVDYINENYFKKITLEELAHKAHYSSFHFIRIFQKETGKTPFAYLTQVRVEKAKEFLSATSQTITEICLQCGFQNSSHFANFFKLHTGLSPSEYRDKAKRKQSQQ